MKTKVFAFLSLLFILGNPLKAQVYGNDWVITWYPYTPCVSNSTTFFATDTSGTYNNNFYQWSLNGQFGWGQNFTTTFTNPGVYQGSFYVNDSIQGLQDTVFFNVFVDSICPNSDLISGTVFHDVNGNAIQDVGEPGVPYATIEVNPGPIYFTTDQSGNYSQYVQAGSFTVSCNPPLYWNVTSPVGNSYALTLPGTNQNFTGNDFGIEATPGVIDVSVDLSAQHPAHGFDFHYFVSVHNNGTTPAFGTVTLDVDPSITFVSATGGGVYAANTVTWTYPSIAPGGFQFFMTQFYVPLPVPVGTILPAYATVTPIAGDVNTVNNYDTLYSDVLAACDPNDKSVFPEGNIGATQDLKYTVRFQNTGTAEAHDIIVRDTLDNNLDISTFKFLGSSHPATWMIDQHVLTVTYSHIMLPDSNTNEPASHGLFSFSITPLPGLADQTTIVNSAAIYFDFEPAVLTNSVTSTVDLSTGTHNPRPSLFSSVYPNPFNDYAFIRMGGDIQGDLTIELFDLSGRKVSTVSGKASEEIRINRNNLDAGMYIYRISNKNQLLSNGRIVIQ